MNLFKYENKYGNELSFCMLGNFACFFFWIFLNDFFFFFFSKNLLGVPSECQTVGSRSGPTFFRA